MFAHRAYIQHTTRFIVGYHAFYVTNNKMLYHHI